MITGLEFYVRVIKESKYIIENEATVRKAAEHFKLSKSTVHRDMVVVLPQYDTMLYDKVKDVIDKNKSLRHIRGGESTKRKHLQK